MVNLFLFTKSTKTLDLYLIDLILRIQLVKILESGTGPGFTKILK